MDLCLHVVRSELGRRGGQRRRALERRRRPTATAARRSSSWARCPRSADGGLASTRAWALERLGEPLTVEDIARHAHMSDRTFARRFLAETGHSPKRWLNAQRIEHARRLLETTDLPVEQVAPRSGLRQRRRAADPLRAHDGDAADGLPGGVPGRLAGGAQRYPVGSAGSPGSCTSTM